jgi:hypothetical protein
MPAGAAKAFHQRIAALAVDLAHFADAIVRTVECCGCRHLDRREGAVIEIGLHAPQRRDDPFVADSKAHAPAGHRESLRHRSEFDGAVDRARHLQHRRRRVVVEIDFGISEIGQDEDLVLLREVHKVLVEIEIGDVGGRVRRIADHDRDRLRDRVHDRALERGEELRRRLRGHRADHAARHQEAEGVDRVARVRRQDNVAGRGDRLRDVGEAFLGAERRDDLRVGIELHAEPASVIGRLRLAQPGDALRRRVTVGARLAERFLELFDDVRRRRQVRVAHAEIDDVGACVASDRLGAVDLLEHVGRQTPYAVKFFHRLGL